MTTGANGQKTCILRTDESMMPYGITGLERVKEVSTIVSFLRGK